MKNFIFPSCKRIFDVIFAFLAVVATSPILLLVGLLINLSDGGPVIFRQERIGKNGVPFILYKFRSMRVLKAARYGYFQAGNQSRVTWVGRILRKTKLDELPQLFNVLEGNMSLVGPRPEVGKWVAVNPEKWKKVLTVLPGITDNASIEFRNEEEFLVQSKNPEKVYRELVLPAKLLLYENYVNHHSFRGDLKLLFKTIYYCLFK